MKMKIQNLRFCSIFTPKYALTKLLSFVTPRIQLKRFKKPWTSQFQLYTLELKKWRKMLSLDDLEMANSDVWSPLILSYSEVSIFHKLTLLSTLKCLLYTNNGSNIISRELERFLILAGKELS